MRNTLKNRFVFWPAVFVAIFAIFTLVIFNVNQSYSSTIPETCSDGSISSSTQTIGTTTVALPLLAEIHITIPATTNATEIKLFAKDSTTSTETLIGHAQPLSTTTGDNSNWVFIWPTALFTRSTTGNGLVSLIAKVSNNVSTAPCVISSSASYYIQYNSTATNLSISVTPPSYTTYVGSSNAQEIKAMPTSLPAVTSADNMIRYGVFTWSTANNDIGGISNSTDNFLSNSSIIFNAGSIAGTNAVKVYYSYGGATSNTVKVPITVKAPENTTPAPTPPATSTTTDTTTGTDNTKTSSAVSTTTPITTSELTTSDQVTSSQLKISTATQSCIEGGLDNTDRYNAIITGKSRPTPEELDKISNCFATSKYILPTSFSPIDPVKIDKLTVRESIAVSNLENVSKTTTSGAKKTLKITGKAAPKSKVFVYIFSDPLVITTTADSDGNWQYTLEDPLIPGKHEVYAIVDKGNGTYERSDPLSFLISTVSASAANPNGLSLELSEPPVKTPTQSQGSLVLYIAGSILAIIIALTVLFLVLRSHNKHKLAVSKITTANPDCTYCNPPKSELPAQDTPTNISAPDQNTVMSSEANPQPEQPTQIENQNNSVKQDNITNSTYEP